MGRVEEAKKEYRKAMSMVGAQAPGPMPEATMQLCNLLIKHSKYREDIEEAADLLSDMIDSGTYQMVGVEKLELADVFDRLVMCLEKLGRFDEALDRMLALCAVQSSSHQIHFEVGRLALLCKEYDLAREHLQFAVSLEPFDMFARFHLALASYHLGGEGLEESAAQCGHILESKPTDVKACGLLAKVHIARGEWAEALRVYEAMSERDPNDAYLLYQMGVVLENMQEEERSRGCFEETAERWMSGVERIGYDGYFYGKGRAKECKALQRIQSRCEHHRAQGDVEWEELSRRIDRIGMTTTPRSSSSSSAARL